MKPLTFREIVRIISGILFVVGAMIWLNGVGPMLDPVWTASSGEPVPRNFSYMLFPRRDAGIMDAAGERIGPFQRALIVDDEHYRIDGPIEVGGGRGARRVARSDLAPTAAPEALSTFISDWGARGVPPAGDVRDPRFGLRTENDRSVGTLKFDRGARSYKFVYEVDGDTVRPLRMYLRSGDLSSLGKFTIFGLLGLIGLFSMVHRLLCLAPTKGTSKDVSVSSATSGP